MGHGYAILVWDEWGAGLVRINPRLHTAGVDMYGNPCNWWPCEEEDTDEDLLTRNGFVNNPHCQVIH